MRRERQENITSRTGNLQVQRSNLLTLSLTSTSFSCKCPLLGQAESGQLMAVSRPSLIRSSTYCFRHCRRKTNTRLAYANARSGKQVGPLREGQCHMTPPHQCTEDALALRDGGHLLQGELSKAQLTGHQGVHGQLPGGTVARRGHLHCC